MADIWNEEAMAKMVREELPGVYNLCFRLSSNREDAEDLSQETFLKAIRAIHKFKGQSTLATWLYRIAVNTWKNKVRHQVRRKFKFHISLSGSAKESGDGDSPNRELNDGRPLPLEQLEKKEGDKKVIAALGNLEENEKAIIVLKDIDQKSYEEIAKVLNLNLGTVKSRLARAREKFRTKFALQRVKTR